MAAAGKPCCIEKPLSPCYQDSKAIVDAFDQAGIPLFVAYYRRSLPRFNKVKALLDQSNIGKVRHITWHLSKPASPVDLSQTDNWRTDKTIAPGGYFDDLASHGLDLFAYLLGDFSAVKGIGLNQQQLYTSFDAISACWSHRSGVTGSGSWNFGGYSRQDKVVLYGSKGELSFSLFDECPITLYTPEKETIFDIANPENIQLCHVQNIRDQLIAGSQHPSTGHTALHTSWVMDEILGNGE